MTFIYYNWCSSCRFAVNMFLTITQLGFCCIYILFVGRNLEQVRTIIFYKIPTVQCIFNANKVHAGANTIINHFPCMYFLPHRTSLSLQIWLPVPEISFSYKNQTPEHRIFFRFRLWQILHRSMFLLPSGL